jgi:hypothetical protein
MENELAGSTEVELEDTAPAVEEVQEAAATDAEETPEEQEEKPARTFTQEELDAKLAKSRNRNERRHRQEISALAAKLEQLEKAQLERGEKATAADDAPEAPKRSDFDSYEDYIEAKADYRAGERIRKELAVLNKDREQERHQQKEATVKERLTKAADQRVRDGRKEFPDFDVVVQEAFDDELIIPQSDLYFGIIDSPVGHRIVMHLAKNPELAEKLNGMSAYAINRELGKLEDKLTNVTKPKAPTMEPISGHGRTPKPNDPMRADISMDEYVRLRNAQERRQRGLS